jgi:hypothetical protein
MMDSIRLKVSRSTITACFWFLGILVFWYRVKGPPPPLLRENVNHVNIVTIRQLVNLSDNNHGKVNVWHKHRKEKSQPRESP